MGNFKRLGLPLVFLTILGLALSSSVSSSFYKVPLGSVTLYDEDRVTKVELIVPIESSLFGNSNNYNEDAVTSLRDLALSCSSYCTRLDQDAGNHSKLTWGAAGSEEPLSSEEVKNLKHKYQLALEELVEAQDLEVDQIKSTVLQNAIRPVVQQLPNTKGTTVKVVGCTSGSEFVISLTSGAAIASDVPIKMVEVADYGRFVNDKKAFVRIDIAQHWAHNKNSGAWYRVDFERCQKSDKTVGFICPESSLSYANECTPADVNGCPVKVDFVKDNFVTNFYMPNGSMVVASNMQQFNTHKTFNIHMPASGVILVDLTSDERITFEQVKIKPMEGAGLPVFKWTSVNTEAHMLFADTHVYEADFDPSGWAFQLSTDGSGDIITITGRRTGAVFVAAAFIVANLWWCVVVSVAVVLSVALTLLTLFCRGRISSTYRHYSPRLQRKRAPSASRSESSTSSTTEEDPELGAADEEFETARKKKLNFANFKISFLGDKGEKLTDRAPTAMSVASDDSADSWRSRYYKNLRQLVSLQSLKAAKKITDDEDAISNIATDGSETDKTTIADVELTAVKVVEKQEKPKTGVNVGILDVAKFLENSSIPEADLVDARHTMLRTRRKPNGENADRMLMNLVDFFALIKYGPGITAEEYNKIKEQEGLPREDCSRFGYALKGLHLKYTLNAGRIYRFHHLVRKFPKTYIIEDSQMGKTTMDQLYKCNFGVELKYPGLPVVAVYPPGGHREFLPIECLQVCEDQELVFASIRLARLAALAEKNMKSAEARVKAELQQQQQQTKITANTAAQAAAKAQPAH